MGKLEKIRIVDPILSQLAMGYSNSDYIADLVFPVVDSMSETGKVRKFTKALFEYHSAIRGIGADSNVINVEETDPISFSMSEYDLATPVDYREQEEAKDIDLERARTYELTERMKLRREKVVADAVQTAGNYTDGNTAAVGTKWDQSSSKPIQDIEAASEVIRANCGRRPNTLILGASTYSDLKLHDQFLSKLTTTKTAVVNSALIAEILDIPTVLVGSPIWINPATGAQADVWQDNAILAYISPAVRDQRSIRTPGFGYTVQKKGWASIDRYPSPGSGGKVNMIRYTTREKQLFLGSIAGYLLRDTHT